MQSSLWESLAQLAQSGDMIFVPMGDENVAELELIFVNQLNNRGCLPAGIKKSGVAGDFVPNQITIHGHAPGIRGERTKLAPAVQVFF